MGGSRETKEPSSKNEYKRRQCQSKINCWGTEVFVGIPLFGIYPGNFSEWPLVVYPGPRLFNYFTMSNINNINRCTCTFPLHLELLIPSIISHQLWELSANLGLSALIVRKQYAISNKEPYYIQKMRMHAFISSNIGGTGETRRALLVKTWHSEFEMYSSQLRTSSEHRVDLSTKVTYQLESWLVL